MSAEEMSSMDPTTVLMSRFTTAQIKTVLWFAAALAEEAGKTDPDSTQM